MPEFKRDVLDSLRQPLEAGEVSVARANAHVTFPARVQLIAAMNPCRCGYLSDPAQACSRAPRCASDYQARISGPLLDRIDLHVDVEAVLASDLIRPADAEGSDQVGARVAQARNVQQQRYGQENVVTNAGLSAEQTEQFCTPDPEGQKLLAQAADSMRLTARSYMRILKVARTIADLAGAGDVTRAHIAEALSYRRQMVSN